MDPNNFAGNFLTLLDNFQAKKPASQRENGNQNKNKDNILGKSKKDCENSEEFGERREEEREDSKDNQRRNEHYSDKKKKINKGNNEKTDRDDLAILCKRKRSKEKRQDERALPETQKSNQSSCKTVSEDFLTILENFDNKVVLNEGKILQSERNHGPKNNELDIGVSATRNINNTKSNIEKERRDFRGKSASDKLVKPESSKSNFGKTLSSNEHFRGGQHKNNDSDNSTKRSVKTMGYKFLENLLDNETSFVVTTLASPRSGFQELVNNQPVRPDLMILILKVLNKINKSEAHQLKVQILSNTFKPEFIDEIKRFVSLICVEDDRKRLLEMNTFFANLLNVLDTVVNSLPSIMNEKLKSTLNALNLSMKGLRDNIDVSDNLFEQLKELSEQVNSYIEHKNKIEKDQSNFGKRDIPPPNSYRDVPLIPTADDFITGKGFLRQNITRGSYNNVDHYLDVQFRLLREDFIAPLREGIHEYLENQYHPHLKRRFSNVRIYPKVKFEVPCNSRDVFGYDIQFDCEKKLPRHINWEYNKRFMAGSLLLFSVDNFQTFYLATVVQRNIEKLKKGLLFVTFVPGTDVPDYLFSPGVFFVMAESEVYYEAYKHVLSALQRMNEKNFPMKQYIVDVDTSCFPPAYLVDKSVYKISNFDVNLLDDKNWPNPEELKLNPSQHQALKSALTNDFVVIQGPPGTGKTFLALKITEILLKNEVSYNTPIVVICYTNHALDQFLEGILKHTKNLIRIGMQSQNEALQKYNLEEVRKKLKTSRNITFSELFKKAINEKQDTQSKLQAVKEKIDELGKPQGILNLNMLRSVITPQQFNELAGNPHQIWSWLFCYDDPEFQSKRSFEGAAETPSDISGTQNQAQAWPENSTGEMPDSSTDVPEEEYEELDEEENARRLADMTEDDFYDDDYIKESFYARSISYSRSFIDIDEQIIATQEERMSMANVTNDYAYYFNQQCIEQIQELKWQGRFMQSQFSRLRDFRFNPERLGMFQNARSVWELNVNDRWEFYATWVYLYICQLKQIVQHLTKMYQDALMKLHELRQLDDLRFVQTAAVVGLTTSGAAKRRLLLENLGTRIVIVEEAAEVLEAHIITSLAHSVQHVILIGDHKQLKPNPAVFKLAKKYNMDCSLFERMINNGLGCSVLNEQHRMRPEIASLITPTIYPHLVNHPSTFDRPKVRGIDRFVFFLSHDRPEDQLPDSSSKQNAHEADLLMELCKYLLLNDYKPSEITILATYTGQVWYMKKKRREMGLSCPEMRAVRITPVDNFQGEENRIILLSLVRSNKENKIGFLSTENRVCVALSRAKEGLYIVGNMDNLTNSSSIWPRIKQQLEALNAVGRKLILRCERHHDQITQVSHAKDFKDVPEGGCSRKCETELNCGHICPRICHIIDQDHGFYKCKQKCERPPCTVEGHKCPLLCWRPCEPCMIPVEKQLLCGHSATLRCHEEPAAHKCLEEVPAIHPACNHEIVKFCYLDVKYCHCTNDCTIWLSCGHACQKKCHVDNDPDHIQYKCNKECVKEYNGCPRKQHPCQKMCFEECGECKVPVPTKLACGHHHKIPCTDDPDSFKCIRDCKRTMKCGHKCIQQCWVTCDETKCTELIDKEAPCGHIMTKMKCNEPTSNRKCKQDCKRTLSCGHNCKRKCFDDCNSMICQELVDSRVKPKCGHPVIKIPCHLNKEELDSGSDELVELCKEDCGKELSCGHKCKGKCGKCLQGRLHIPCEEKCSKILICGHECKSKCGVLCPPCLTRKCLTRCSHRGECFVPQSKNHPCFKFCDPACDKQCTWVCEHYQCKRRCWEECNRPPCLKPCPEQLGCGHKCMGYCGEMCPPLCALCDANTAIPGHRYVVLQDCKCVVDSKEMDNLVEYATKNGIFQLMICPKPDCSKPIANTLRYRHVYIGFRKQTVKIENILKNDEIHRLLKLHARHVDILGSEPTTSTTLNKLMKICSMPFRVFPGKETSLDPKEMGRLIVGCLLQPLAVRCMERKKKKFTTNLNDEWKLEEQRLKFRLEYLAGALGCRINQISYDTILQLELLIIQILRLTSEKAKAHYSGWFKVAPYTWQEDRYYNQVEPFPRLSSSLRTRDSTKQWFICDNQHLYVSENRETCIVCKDEEEENRRRQEEKEAREREKQEQRPAGQHKPRQQQAQQAPVVTDFRNLGTGRGRRRWKGKQGGRGKGGGNRGGGNRGRGRGQV